jgi:hypothetical protein
VINAPGSDAVPRLYLPVPPHYPDEVRARLWARGTGYQMAPTTVCPITAVRAASGGESNQEGGGDSNAPAPAGVSYRITSPSPGATLNGTTPILGTAQFDPAGGAYYKLDIGSGATPTAWTTFGATHSQPVANGQLETLYAGSLAPGAYVIRLIIVGPDGNYAGAPHAVPITISP